MAKFWRFYLATFTNEKTDKRVSGQKSTIWASALLTIIFTASPAQVRADEVPDIREPLSEIFHTQGRWSTSIDPFNDDQRLAVVFDTSSVLKVRLQWYCPEEDVKQILGVGVEGHPLDTSVVRREGSGAPPERALWVRTRMNKDTAYNYWARAEDDYHFSVPAVASELRKGERHDGDAVLIGFPVNGREIQFVVTLDDVVRSALEHTCPRTKNFDPMYESGVLYPDKPPEQRR